ncbi:HTH_Tnp_Tc3_2 domain-containing protein [Trichonephila clavipes]|nr:HTH_Tnp_Tc3_2 domain-containing protein [Trichonephila clavipes]
MPRVRSRNAYQQVSGFDKGQIVAYRNCGLPYHTIAARIGRDPMTVSRMWNQWVQNGNTKCRARSQQHISLAFEKQVCYSQGFNGSCSHITSPESRIGVVCKTKSVCTNTSTTFAAAWALSSDQGPCIFLLTRNKNRLT